MSVTSDRAPESSAIDLSNYDVEIASGRIRVYYKTPEGQPRTLIRSETDPRQRLSEHEIREILASQAEATKAWKVCENRLNKVDTAATPPQSDDDTLAGAAQHDALLEVTNQLEQQLARDPDHLGILRDLCIDYARLLVFERNSALEPTICVQCARRLTEFEQKAAPLDDPDLASVKNIRAWLFYARGIHPAAANLTDEASGGPDAVQLRKSLAALGQDQFEQLPPINLDKYTCRVYRSRGESPNRDLLWGEVYFIVSPTAEERPERTVAYVLTRRGTEFDPRYYLYFRSLFEIRMIELYGNVPPSLPVLRSRVGQMIKTTQVHDRNEK